MKKIKQKLEKRKVKGKPSIGLLLHAEYRVELVRFTLEWCQTLQRRLSETIDIKLWVSDTPNAELDAALANLDQTQGAFERLSVAAGSQSGARRNEALVQLKDQGLDAVISLEPGDMLTPSLLSAYAEHLKSGGLFCGLLDQYLYDPSALRCMHWARAEFNQGLKRTCDLGMMISLPILERLGWTLWPPSANRGRAGLHERVMERLSKLFSSAPPKTCLLQSMGAYGGRAVSIKSELGRVLFDEGNWQRLPGLSFADFEIDFGEELGEAWLERVEDLDERINLAVLVEPPRVGASHTALWRELYQFLPYKFDPYAHVQVHVICQAGEEADVESWGSAFTPVTVKATSGAARWNEAVAQLSGDTQDTAYDAILFGGTGSVVDLKTIEHYLIYLFKHGARMMCASNFFVTLETDQERQGHFWPGLTNTGFTKSFGFGTCLHRSYVERLGAELFSDQGGMSDSARAAFEAITANSETKRERVMFQCVAHKLGLIAFEAEGALGYSSQIRLADLKPVTISQHLPTPAFVRPQHELFQAWERGETLHVKSGASMSDVEPHEFEISPAPFTSQETSMSNDTSADTMSPLERAKALLRQSQGGAPAAPKADAQPAATESATAPKSEMSPLERAKALLKQSSEPAATEPAPAPAAAPAPQSEMSPLERAKALLKQSTQSEPATPAPAPAPQSEMSPLERAKALLKQSTQSAPAPEPEPTPQEVTSSVIDQAVQGAEALVAHLESQVEAARTQESAQNANSGPAVVLCEQGEDAFAAGDVTRSVALFESALLVDPSCTRALNNLGVIALQGDEPWRALSFLLMGFIQNPGDEDVAINLQGLFDLHPEMKTARAVIFDA